MQKFSLAALTLFSVLAPNIGYAASVSLTPLVQSADCTTQTTLSISGTSDSYVINFAPNGLWYNAWGDESPPEDIFGNVMQFSDNGIDCGTQAPNPLFGEWIFAEVPTSTINTVNDCSTNLTYADCLPYIINEYPFTITEASTGAGTTTSSFTDKIMTYGLMWTLAFLFFGLLVFSFT